MSIRGARAIAYGAVAVLAVVAVVFISPLPPRANTPAGEILTEDHAEHMLNERHDTVGKGESLVSVLARGGVSEVVAREALRAAQSREDALVVPTVPAPAEDLTSPTPPVSSSPL